MKLVLATLLTLASALSVRSQPLETHWSTDGQRCWYEQRKPGNQRSFYIVDVDKRQKSLAFDHRRLADSLSEKQGEPVSAKQLPISRLDFGETPAQLILTGQGKSWALDLTTYQLTPKEKSDSDQVSRKLFLPPRPSGAGGDSTEFTVVNRLSKPVELIWMAADGKRVTYKRIPPGESHAQHTYVGHIWLVKDAAEELGCFRAKANDYVEVTEALVNSTRSEEPRQTRRRPNRVEDQHSAWEAFVREHDLWVRHRDRGAEVRLTKDATQEHTFLRRASYQRLTEMSYNAEDAADTSADVRWSTDGNHFIAFQTPEVPERRVYYVESSPKDQLQPKLQSYPYAKPGDPIPVKTIRLFSVKQAREIPLANTLFPNPFRLRFLGWSDTGDSFQLHYNERGHQVVRLLEVRAADGHVRTIAEETSNTFVHYSNGGKSVRQGLPNGELLWASERTGWNHLYRYRISNGELINPVTTGDWNVKRIEKVDQDRGLIWFFAVGIHPEQDPYHEHFCRVNIDGSDFRVLTEGDGTHSIRFEQDDQYFIDTYSRVDMAPVVELRDARSGELICELDRDEAADHFQDRKLTTRFVAKGRDGQTDIWGIIHWPKQFDPEKTYPVVENIYAGPHNHHVPKSFRKSFRHQYQIADAGMIVVQIDGMGTAWRSKKFHDRCFKNLRDAGFPDRIAWMKAAAEKYPQMDISRVGIYGGSAGGQNAMAALLWHNDFYNVAVADCGCHDNRMDKIWWNEQWMGWPVDESYAANSNMENAHLLEGKLMLVLGELDRNVDPASTTQVVRKLIEHDKDFEFVLVAGAGHGSAETPWASRKRLNFLKEHLGASP